MATMILPLIHQPGCRAWVFRDNDECDCNPIEFAGMPTCEAEDPDEGIPCGNTPTVVVTDPDGYEHILCTECAAPLEPWACPWCGDASWDGNSKPDHSRPIFAWDRWLEAHVTECEPALAEMGD